MSKTRKIDCAAEFAANLKKMRILRGIKGPELAEKCGIGYRSMNNYELGKRQPKLEKLGWICEALEVTPNDLLGYSEHQAVKYSELARCIEHVIPVLQEQGADWDEIASAIVAAYSSLVVFGVDPASLVSGFDEDEIKQEV